MNFGYMFSSFIATEQLSFDLKKLEQKCYRIKDDDQGCFISNYKGWHSSNITENDFFQPLINEIEKKSNDLNKELGINANQKIHGAWININQKNCFNEPHNHLSNNCFLSGVFYISVPEKSGILKFLNNQTPTENWINNKQIEQYNCFNSNVWKIHPKENLLVLFPSWLSHYVLPNESDYNRISIAFNTKLI
jgi:hypothetical protein